MHRYRLLFWVLFTVVSIFFLYRLARESDILRDRGPVPWGQRKRYSLSAVQGAWWFHLILVSFIFIWLVTGQYHLSSTALVLLGISFGTGLLGTVIDANKKEKPATGEPQGNSADLDVLLIEKQKLEDELSILQRKGGRLDNAHPQKLEYDAKIDEIQKKFPKAIRPPHVSFYLDILSDTGSVSFHCFQMLIWTFVLGIFFVYSVLNRLAMPQFSETLLWLMGLGAGTYLGFKIPENTNLAK